jgi:hypothetical protein
MGSPSLSRRARANSRSEREEAPGLPRGPLQSGHTVNYRLSVRCNRPFHPPRSSRVLLSARPSKLLGVLGEALPIQDAVAR